MLRLASIVPPKHRGRASMQVPARTAPATSIVRRNRHRPSTCHAQRLADVALAEHVFVVGVDPRGDAVSAGLRFGVDPLGAERSETLNHAQVAALGIAFIDPGRAAASARAATGSTARSTAWSSTARRSSVRRHRFVWSLLPVVLLDCRAWGPLDFWALRPPNGGRSDFNKSTRRTGASRLHRQWLHVEDVRQNRQGVAK